MRGDPASLRDSKDGWFLSSANAINDGGQIVGDGFIDGQQHAFLLSPTLVPEPDSSALILFGLGVIVMIAVRRRFNT
jgi:probable HAF family extracellular repeat protein